MTRTQGHFQQALSTTGGCQEPTGHGRRTKLHLASPLLAQASFQAALCPPRAGGRTSLPVLCPWGLSLQCPPRGQGLCPHGHGSSLYLVLGGKAAATLVPCDGGLGLPSHHTVQIQGLPLGYMGGGGLDADGLGATWG